MDTKQDQVKSKKSGKKKKKEKNRQKKKDVVLKYLENDEETWGELPDLLLENIYFLLAYRWRNYCSQVKWHPPETKHLARGNYPALQLENFELAEIRSCPARIIPDLNSFSQFNLNQKNNRFLEGLRKAAGRILNPDASFVDEARR